MSHTHTATHKRRPLTSADLIRAARAAAREKAGVRVKVRFPSDLIRRARECSADVADPLGEWINKACRQWRTGAYAARVADAEKTRLATRAASECITVRAPSGMTATDIKTACAAACHHCEARRVAYTLTVPPRYILEDSEHRP